MIVLRLIVLVVVFLLNSLGIRTNTPIDILSYEWEWDSQLHSAQEIYAMCMALEESGYELHYLSVYDVAVTVVYSDGQQATIPAYTSVSIWTITYVERDFDGFFPVTEQEEQRLTQYSQNLCHEIRQIGADLMFYNPVVSSITLYEWVQGIQTILEPSVLGDCDSMVMTSVWTGGYGDPFAWEQAESVCPPGLTDVENPLQRNIR